MMILFPFIASSKPFACKTPSSVVSHYVRSRLCVNLQRVQCIFHAVFFLHRLYRPLFASHTVCGAVCVGPSSLCSVWLTTKDRELWGVTEWFPPQFGSFGAFKNCRYFALTCMCVWVVVCVWVFYSPSMDLLSVNSRSYCTLSLQRHILIAIHGMHT